MNGRGDARFVSDAGVDVRAVRHWVRGEFARLGAERVDLGDVDLMVDEIAANALRHTASGRSGGGVRAAVREAADVVRVEITDDGGAASLPVARTAPDAGDEWGRGLTLVAALAERWGFEGSDAPGRPVTVWFEVARR